MVWTSSSVAGSAAGIAVAASTRRRPAAGANEGVLACELRIMKSLLRVESSGKEHREDQSAQPAVQGVGLLVAERLDGVQPRGFPGRVGAEDDPDPDGNGDGGEGGGRRGNRRPAQQRRDCGG